jgi:hypothetical protein
MGGGQKAPQMGFEHIRANIARIGGQTDSGTGYMPESRVGYIDNRCFCHGVMLQ